MYISKNQSGFTFIEMITAITIFAFIMLMATGIFQMVVEGQRQAVNAQDIQESMRYAMEVIGKEIRTAQGEHGGSTCGPAAPAPGHFKTYNTDESIAYDPTNGLSAGNILYFKTRGTSTDICVMYYLNNGRLEISRKNGTHPAAVLPITPDEVKVSNLEFRAINDPADEFHYLQGLVTVRMDVAASTTRAIDRQAMTIQTTISSRYYE